jgi:hypothetical protein
VAPEGYLHGVLADGAQPFRHRARIRTLLGLPEDTGVQVSFNPTPPGVGFTYLHHPYAHGEPYLPYEAVPTAPHWLNHATDDVVDTPLPATTVDDRPPAAAGPPPDPRGPLPATHPAPAPGPEPGSAVVISRGTAIVPAVTAIIPGVTAPPEHRGPASDRPDTGTAPSAPPDGPAPSSAEQALPGAWTPPRHEGSAVSAGLPPVNEAGRSGDPAHRDDPTTPQVDVTTAVTHEQLAPSGTASSATVDNGMDHRLGVVPHRPAAARRPSPAPAREFTAAHPAQSKPAQPDSARPEPAPDVDQSAGESAVTHRSRPIHRGMVARPDIGRALGIIESPYRRTAPDRPTTPGWATASGRATAPETPPAEPAGQPAATPQVVVVREPAPAAVGTAAFWERRYLSWLRARILR